MVQLGLAAVFTLRERPTQTPCPDQPCKAGRMTVNKLLSHHELVSHNLISDLWLARGLAGSIGISQVGEIIAKGLDVRGAARSMNIHALPIRGPIQYAENNRQQYVSHKLSHM